MEVLEALTFAASTTNLQSKEWALSAVMTPLTAAGMSTSHFTVKIWLLSMGVPASMTAEIK